MGKTGGGNAPSKKTEQKQKAKVVEDLTFGLKNKNKSKTVQKYDELLRLISEKDSFKSNNNKEMSLIFV